MSDRSVRGTVPNLSPQESAVLNVLVDSHGRVVGRREMARRIGLVEVNERRCDSLLVGIRRALGPDSIRTVRARGWMLEPAWIETARTLLARSHESLTQPKHSQDSCETLAP